MKYFSLHVMLEGFGIVFGSDPDFYVNKNLGYARSNTPSTKLVVGTSVPVRYNLRYQNSLISKEEIVSDIGERIVACDTEDLIDAIEKINDLLSNKFETIFKELAIEIKSRADRAVPAWVIQAGVSVAVPLLTKAGSHILEWVIGTKREKPVSRSELERQQALATKWIKESTLELCALSASTRKQRINDIGLNLIRKLESELQLSLVDLASDDLPTRHIINACMTVNSMLSSGQCISLIKESRSKVTYRIETIELVEENEAVVSLILQVPIVSRVLKGYDYINVGKPHLTADGAKWLLLANIPSMQLLNGEYVKLHMSSPEEQVVQIENVEFNFSFDEDCVKDGKSNERDGTCDVISKRVFSEISMQRLHNFQLMATFRSCYIKDCTSESGSTLLEGGVHALAFEGKNVQCGQSSFDLCREPTFEHLEISADNYSVPINYIPRHLDQIDISLFDEDNNLERSKVGPVSLRVLLITLIISAPISLLLIFYLFWKKIWPVKKFSLGAIRAY